MLRTELGSRFHSYYDGLPKGRWQASPERIRVIYDYATWCRHTRSDDTSNAATIGFYYDVPVNAFNILRSDPSTYEQIIKDLISGVGLPEIKRLRWAFAALIEPHQLEKFIADCDRVARDLRWELQNKQQERRPHVQVFVRCQNTAITLITPWVVEPEPSRMQTGRVPRLSKRPDSVNYSAVILPSMQIQR
jgi:hypothetical protein